MAKAPIQMTPADDTHLTLLMAPQSLNFFTGQDREHLLAFGRAVFEAGQASKCLHQIAEPAAIHPDDAAVDALAEAMKAKLTKQREKGYGGWDTDCTQERLSELLRQHVDKGDPVDVANFCAFLQARGEGIAAAPQAVQPALPGGLDKREDWIGLERPGTQELIDVMHTRGAFSMPIKDREPIMRCIAKDALAEVTRLKALLAATQPAAQGLDAEPKLNATWKARLLDGAPLSRDKYGCGSHPALPIFFEGVKCKDFFEALGIELRLWFAEYEMEAEAYEAMSDGFTEDGENYNAWTPKKPEGDGWCLVAIFDTEDGAACWWLRDAVLAAQAKQGGA